MPLAKMFESRLIQRLKFYAAHADVGRAATGTVERVGLLTPHGMIGSDELKREKAVH
jgi:hypothetical protein